MLRSIWDTLRKRASRLGADAVEASRFAARPLSDTRRELDAALAAALEPGEHIEVDTWSQLSRKRSRAADPADVDVSTPLGMLRAAGSAVAMLRGTVGWVDSAMPVRVVLTDRRLLVAQRTVTAPATVRAAPRSGARVVRRRLWEMDLDPGDGGPPLRLWGTLEGDDLEALAAALAPR